MDRQRIQFVNWQRDTYEVEVKDAYEYRPNGRLPWLQRIIFWIACKLGAYHLSERVEVHAVEFSPETFMEALYFQRRSLFEHFNREPKYLLIGSEDFDELMHTAVKDNLFSFDARYYCGTRSGPEIMGLKVCVVPWMKGCVVLPEGLV